MSTGLRNYVLKGMTEALAQGKGRQGHYTRPLRRVSLALRGTNQAFLHKHHLTTSFCYLNQERSDPGQEKLLAEFFRYLSFCDSITCLLIIVTEDTFC